MAFYKLTLLKRIIAIAVLYFLHANTFAQQYIAEGRFPLAPLPETVPGVKNRVFNINKGWKINLSPLADFWNDQSIKSSWHDILVPGEPSMQGFKIKHDVPFVYRNKISIPAVSSNKTILIRFNGVYSYARVWINGNFIREHTGGFTAWDCDITKYVQPGKDAWLHVEVTDKIDDISYASGYAHHLIGGILRKVELVILPLTHIQRLYADASLDEALLNGRLQLNIALNKAPGNCAVEYNLFAPGGKPVWKKNQKVMLPGGKAIKDMVIPDVKKWTAENPLLYRLKINLIQNGRVTERVEQWLGFRRVDIENRALLVNGRVTKLRGACRHDLHPLLGRSTDRKQDSLDVRLAKEANLNFIRTSHYPPSADFLEFCNRYGIYVQEETAICFATYKAREEPYKKHGGTHNNPAYTAQYLGQLSEMIDHDRNHPCIIMWSIGNESTYGINFQKEYEFVKAVDRSRPVSWSWPKSAIDSGKRCFDIGVSHYPDYKGEKADLGGFIKGFEHPDYPILNDEWAHVACYPKGMLMDDPNISDFWGQSIELAWANRFDTPTNIGGAIWGMIDEVFHQKDTVSGYGPWGFIDVWRRKKAEFWHVKKAYSPIRVLQTSWTEIKGEWLEIPVKNRFDHTNLSSIKLRLTQHGKTTILALPNIEPHQTGIIRLNIKNNPEQEALLQFIDSRGNMLDEEKITWRVNSIKTSQTSRGFWNVEEKGTSLILSNSNHLEISLNSKTGELEKASVNTKPLITGTPTPIINRPAKPTDWYRPGEIFSGTFKVNHSEILKEKAKVMVSSKGFVDAYPVNMLSTFYANGQIEINYSIDSIPEYTWQIGVEIPVASSLNEIEWLRKGRWSTYPVDHLSSIKGHATAFPLQKETYRVKPLQPVKDDINNYYLANSANEEQASLKAPQSFRSTKENIYSYTIYNNNQHIGLKVVSEGSQAAKMKICSDGKQALQVLNQWAYWGLGWGNYEGEKNTQKNITGTIRFSLTQ